MRIHVLHDRCPPALSGLDFWRWFCNPSEANLYDLEELEDWRRHHGSATESAP